MLRVGTNAEIVGSHTACRGRQSLPGIEEPLKGALTMLAEWELRILLIPARLLGMVFQVEKARS